MIAWVLIGVGMTLAAVSLLIVAGFVIWAGWHAGQAAAREVTYRRLVREPHDRIPVSWVEQS